MGKNILICDDAAFMRMMIKDILSKNGYNVVGEAENGAVAVDKYSELKPDLVLMDITMPEMDGIQALKKIKEKDSAASVIMCSAMGQQAMVIESIQSGAKDFIVKPFQADRVLEAVKKVIGQYENDFIIVIRIHGKFFATDQCTSDFCICAFDYIFYNSVGRKLSKGSHEKQKFAGD